MIRDPVCGADVTHEQYVFCLEYKGDKYCFCSVQCRRRFETEPKDYARPALARAVGRVIRWLKAEQGDGVGTRCC